jgi:hypothetical protein
LPKPLPVSFLSSRSASNAVATPMGTLMKKIRCQLIAWVSIPPAKSPTEPLAEATKLKTPIALACSRGSPGIW